MRYVNRGLLIIVLAVSALLLASCLSAQEHDAISYDPAKDQFRMLMVLTDIRGKDTDDLDYLLAIYKNRDHLIAPVLPGGANALSLVSTSFLRLNDKQVFPLNIYSSRPSEISPVDTTVALNTIEIHPGTFFVENQKLGYYQSVTIPGKAVDAALEEVSKSLQTEDMAKAIQTEIDRRAAGGKTATWAQVTAETLKQITIEPDTQPATMPATTAAATTTASEEIEPQYALDTDSLKALKQAITDKSLRLARDKDKISLTLPLSARDSAAVADLYKAVLAKAQEVVKNTKSTPEVADKLQSARAALQAASALAVGAGDKGATVALDLTRFGQAMASMSEQRVDMNSKDDAAKDGPDAVKYMQDKNVPLDKTLTAAQIEKDFSAGTLKAFPSAPPVKPGEGIVAPK